MTLYEKLIITRELKKTAACAVKYGCICLAVFFVGGYLKELLQVCAK